MLPNPNPNPNPNQPSLEIATFNLPSALLAARSHASRIELCTSQPSGGLTPSLSDFKTLHTTLSATKNPTPINVMIRPHSRSFIYTPSELSRMGGEVEIFEKQGASGFVFGVLTTDNKIDVLACKQLLSMTGKPCTYHRAFDLIQLSEMASQLEVLIDLGFKGVLTSGGGKDAVEGKEVLKMLVERAAGRIDVIVGGGVRGGNVEGLREGTGASWFHSSAVVDGGEVACAEEVERLRCVLGI